MNNTTKMIIIILLVSVVAATLYLKAQPAGKEAEITTDSPANVKAEGDILAVVNGEKIGIDDFEKSFNRLPRQNRERYKDNKELYLDQLVMQTILKQELQKRGLVTEYSTEREIQNEANKLLDKMSMEAVVEVSEEEMREFYNENQSQMQGAGFEEVGEEIRAYLQKQKQLAVSENYVKDLHGSAEVSLNAEWIQKQIAARPKDPLAQALQNGMATVLDMGSDSCIPCKMMKPIFAELEEEYKDKANILLLMIADYRGLASRYNVRVIPTQIFFDQNGEQYYRHEGFMAKEDIIAKLKEVGVE